MERSSPLAVANSAAVSGALFERALPDLVVRCARCGRGTQLMGRRKTAISAAHASHQAVRKCSAPGDFLKTQANKLGEAINQMHYIRMPQP